MKAAIVHNHPIHYKHLVFTELKRRGLDFDVIFLGNGSTLRHEAISLRNELYRSSIAWPGPYEHAPTWRRGLFPWHKLNEFAPDVVVISSYYAIECWSAWLWASLHRRPVVMWFESNEFDYPRHWPKESLKRLFCRQVRRAHVYGATNKEYLIKLGIPKENIDIKRAVVDVERFACRAPRSYQKKSEPRKLLYVGRLAPEKNVRFLICAFARAMAAQSGPRMELILAGRGPCAAELRHQARLLGVGEWVTFLDYVPQASLPKLYRSVDFFVLPSVREPWGLVSLEAMLGRLPVLISTQCGCAKDVVTPANGWTFSPFRTEELTSLIAALPELPVERLQAMGNASFEIASEYSAGYCAEVIIDSIKSVVAGKGLNQLVPSASSILHP
jgi:1,2-diacylglycerol 3-alpha-glucosyltransferase